VIASSGGLTIDSVAKHSRRKLPPLPLLPPAPRPSASERGVERVSAGVVERMSGRFPVPPMTGKGVRRGPSTPELGAAS
jgi:hypothetical protein